VTTRTLEPELLHRMDAYWRAANYLSVEHHLYINTHGQDLPEIRDWTWNPPQTTSTPPMGGRAVFAEFSAGQRRRDNKPTSDVRNNRHDR
jgi:hypothetical protein